MTINSAPVRGRAIDCHHHSKRESEMEIKKGLYVVARNPRGDRRLGGTVTKIKRETVRGTVFVLDTGYSVVTADVLSVTVEPVCILCIKRPCECSGMPAASAKPANHYNIAARFLSPLIERDFSRLTDNEAATLRAWEATVRESAGSVGPFKWILARTDQVGRCEVTGLHGKTEQVSL